MSLFGTDTSGIERKLDKVVNALTLLTDRITKMTEALDRLKASEAALVAKIDEAVALLHALKAKVDDLIAAGNNSADLAAIADQADAALAKLGAEVSADALA